MSIKRVQVGKLEVIAFVSGFALMAFELAAARILAPSIGSSTYIWTSVIGVIIAALSLGYWAGGKVADARQRTVDVARLCLAIALAIGIVLVVYEPILRWVATSFDDPRLQGVAASLVLFAPTSFLLGMLSPYLVKLKVTSLATSGSSVASLSALNSVGGIVGTFAVGFVLFGYIGSHETFGVVAALMMALSWLLVPRVEWRLRTVASLLILVCATTSVSTVYGLQIDTPSARYTVFEGQLDDRRVRGIATGPHATQSGIFPDYPHELVFWYTRQIDTVVAAQPTKDRILVLGGGTLTLPQHLARLYPQAVIDVVEIDPKLADIARAHFEYADPANVRLIFDDARTYVNETTVTYDIVIVDVYGDVAVPFSLMTREYGDRIAALTRRDGVVIANMIAGPSEACQQLLRAMDSPYRRHFPVVRHVVERPTEPFSNYIVTYARQAGGGADMSPLTLPGVPLYTDNFAPAERLQQACRK